jgi:hypothetical protein
MHRLFGGKKKAPPPKKPQGPPPGPKKPVKQIDLSEQAERMGAKEKVLQEKVNDLDKQIAVLYKKTKKSRGASQRMNK